MAASSSLGLRTFTTICGMSYGCVRYTEPLAIHEISNEYHATDNEEAPHLSQGHCKLNISTYEFWVSFQKVRYSLKFR